MYLEQLFGLKGKVAVITGGGRGIGQIVAQGLAKAGAAIAIISRTGAQATVEKIQNDGGQAYDILADITNEQAVDMALNEIYEHYGSIDIVFNNAAIPIQKDTLATSIDEWKAVIDNNLTGTYIVSRAAAGIMIKSGIPGSIINNASMSGFIVNSTPMQTPYNVSKAGIIHMTRCLAVEWAQHQIRVNAISPGYIVTPFTADMPKDLIDSWNLKIPFCRIGKAEELVGAVIYLASQASTYTTGHNLIIDGGYTCL